jgi:hypothetical protein
MVEIKNKQLCSEVIRRIAELSLSKDEKLRLIEGIEYEFLVSRGNIVKRPIKRLKFFIMNLIYKFFKRWRRFVCL